MDEKLKYVKLNYLEEISSGNKDFMNEIINMFLKQVPEFIVNLRKYLEEEKYEELSREAHTAKSSALIFEMEDTGNLLKQIEIIARDNKDNSLPALIDHVENDLKKACRELEQYINASD